MSLIEYIILSFALAIPVMPTIKACASSTHIRLTQGLFGCIQIALMHVVLLLMGMSIGRWLCLGMPEYDNLIYLGLLIIVAVRLLFAAFSKREKPAYDISRWSVWLLLGVATGINTLFVGLGLGFLVSPLTDGLLAAIPLFFVMWLMCYLAVMLGRRDKPMRERRWLLLSALFLLVFAIKGAFYGS